MSQLALPGQSQHDRMLENSGNQQENYQLDKWTIDWEDAIRREHEYRKKVKLAHGLAGISESSSADSQGPSLNDNISMGKSTGLQVNDWLGSVYKLKDDTQQQHCLSTQLSSQRNLCPSPEKLTHKKQRLQICQGQQSCQVDKILLEKQTTILRTPQQSSQVGHIPMLRQIPIPQTPNQLHHNYWCHICKVNCVSEANFMLHLHGQKHKMNMSKLSLKKSVVEKGFVWCKECNIPCTNLNILAQHRMGKKHLARIEILAKYRARGATTVLPEVNTHLEHKKAEGRVSTCSLPSSDSFRH